MDAETLIEKEIASMSMAGLQRRITELSGARISILDYCTIELCRIRQKQLLETVQPVRRVRYSSTSNRMRYKQEDITTDLRQNNSAFVSGKWGSF